MDDLWPHRESSHNRRERCLVPPAKCSAHSSPRMPKVSASSGDGKSMKIWKIELPGERANLANMSPVAKPFRQVSLRSCSKPQAQQFSFRSQLGYLSVPKILERRLIYCTSFILFYSSFHSNSNQSQSNVEFSSNSDPFLFIILRPSLSNDTLESLPSPFPANVASRYRHQFDQIAWNQIRGALDPKKVITKS